MVCFMLWKTWVTELYLYKITFNLWTRANKLFIAPSAGERWGLHALSLQQWILFILTYTLMSVLLSSLRSCTRGTHRHPRGWPVVCRPANLPSRSLYPSTGHGEKDHLISLSSLSVQPYLAQLGDEPGPLSVCCPQDVACPRRGCSFFVSLLTLPVIFLVFSAGRHCWTCKDIHRPAGEKKKE